MMVWTAVIIVAASFGTRPDRAAMDSPWRRSALAYPRSAYGPGRTSLPRKSSRPLAASTRERNVKALAIGGSAAHGVYETVAAFALRRREKAGVSAARRVDRFTSPA